MKRRSFLQATAAIAAALPFSLRAQEDLSDLIQEAYIYLYPMVKNYLTLYQYAVDVGGSQYKGPFNFLTSIARVYTPEDTAIITPNSDTPYSFVVMDLRAEPIVLTLPKIEDDRYYSAQIIDLYTHDVDYLGTRKDGNGGGDFMITGPGWKGKVPAGVKRVVELPTWLGLVIFRTQLFNPGDIEQVKRIQADYKSKTLSGYTGTSAPRLVSKVAWPEIDDEKIVSQFWPIANFLLQFAPPLAWEASLRESFGKLGLKPGSSWPEQNLAPAKAMRDMVPAQYDIIYNAVRDVKDSSTLFGNPEEMKGRYMDRAMAALGGIYGNPVKEAYYVMYPRDAAGALVDAGKHNYIMRLNTKALPPVNAFWSLTMYSVPQQLLVANPINRYLINSTMLGDLKVNEVGEIVLYVQHENPGAERESNWLPAPKGPFYALLRLYMPKPEASSGAWKAPILEVMP